LHSGSKEDVPDDVVIAPETNAPRRAFIFGGNCEFLWRARELVQITGMDIISNALAFDAEPHALLSAP